MKRFLYFAVPAALSLIVLAAASGITAASQPSRITASSEWGPGYGAPQAADGIAGENGNYWQTVHGKDRGAWWQQDLGDVFPVQAVTIAWARYEDKIHCPPARMTLQLSLTGAEGSWKELRSIGPGELPRDQQQYDAEHKWRYALPQPSPARYVRLLFPEGGQPGAKYPGYLCLGEVEVQARGFTPRIVTIEGRFGKIEMDTYSPSLVTFFLRGPAGLGPQSILARSGALPWAKGAYTYVVGNDEKRYESRSSRPEKVEMSEVGGRSAVRISGVRLSDGKEVIATEDWSLSAPGDGSQFVWKIVRRWEKETSVTLSGSPALFFFFGGPQPNWVTSTIWYDPIRIAAGASPMYAVVRIPGMISENHLQWVRDRDTWAIYKLWTNWHAPVDLRLEVEGGHLYRRGNLAYLCEAGAVTSIRASSCGKGEVEEITLKIAPVDKKTTGYQLAITLPDKAAEGSLKDFYGSVLNGGAVNDQKGFDFGNETDGFYYAGSSWMFGMAIAAGIPAAGPLASHPYDVPRAFRGHLDHIMSVLDEKGRAHFGYNQGGAWVDDNLHTIVGTSAYLLHSGDLPFVRQHLPAMERMLSYFIQRRNDQGLFKLDDVGPHWYYDAITTSGVNGYYNAFFYKAALDLADMEDAAGRSQKSREYRALADSVKTAFNRVLWRESLPGGPRYADWIDAQGKEVAYFCDLCQWPPVAVGIASPEQARKIVATADARIKELEKQYGYRGYAGLSALWPAPQSVNPIAWQTFGNYMNGGSLLCQTYWEIVARARAGDAEGAARRLKGFARRAAETSWVGANAFTITGEAKGGEPYLADMVAATAGVIHGVLGIRPTWQRLEVTPHLPTDWPRAEADVVYKGRRHHVTIEGTNVQIEPRERLIEMPILWDMDANLRTGPAGAATAANIDFGDGSSIALARLYEAGSPMGLWKLDEADGPVRDSSPYRNHGALSGEGITRGEAGHGPASKGYRFTGKGGVQISADGSLSFGPKESFTLQCWFKTDTTDNRVMLGKGTAWCLYVKNGKLATWLMEDGDRFKEALGSGNVADAKWHHATAVVDRAAQRLSLYLDGKLDTPNNLPGHDNPADISSIGESGSRAAVMLGSLDGGFRFVGWLDEVSVFRGALKPAEFGVQSDYPASLGAAPMHYAASGSYQSPPCDWGAAVALAELTVAAELSHGTVTATVQTSDDDFKTIRAQTSIPIRDGLNAHPLDSLGSPARAARVRFDLRAGKHERSTPVVDAFRVIGKAGS